jgi:O-antigen/teichoic acid export membrane protein
MASQATGSSGKIIHNSFWYGLETVIEMVAFFGTSIAVARYLGPEKLGYFSYINLFVIIITRTSGTGLSTATRKYMSEFIALERLGTARAVYNLACRYQFIGAGSITVLGLAGVLIFGDPHFRLMSSILMLSILPGLMSWVPAQANMALEDMSKNAKSALGYILVYTFVIVLTIWFRWDLVGVAAASLVGRTVEVFLRTIPLNRFLRTLPLDPLDSEIVQRIRRFCVQALGLQILMSVVWDRSEMFFLRAFSSLEQMAFYSVSFTIANNNLMMFPRILGSSTGVTLMVEATRDPTRIASIVQNACRYLLFIILPVCLGAAAVAFPAIHLAYGARYANAVPVLVIAAILVIPRAFQLIPEVLLRTADLQNRILVWYSVTGIINIALDYFFIRHHGAVAAAWANGIAQCFGVIAIWEVARRVYTFSFPIQAAIRMSAAAAIMAGIAFAIDNAIPGFPGLILAIATAVPIYLVLVKVFHGLAPSDRERLAPIGNRLPAPVRRAYLAAIEFITPATA